ncbi:MAG: class D beta-lactamase [Bacteroidales bacterium]|nr:class D beta-lactamase [Bacteroidales bacterium]
MKLSIYTLGVILLLFANIAVCFAEKPVEMENAEQVFQKYKVNGSILIYDQNENEYSGYNLERCNTGFIPASTFKIPNTLIALEAGVITADSIFRWDGEKKSNPGWESDMSIGQAFQVSNVPIYQDIAQSIGLERMKEYVRLLHFGEMDIYPDNLDKFWLEGNSQITQYQQIYFLYKLYNGELPLKKETMDHVKQIMLLEKTEDYALSAKTGWSETQGKDIGWFVGYFETEDNVYFFATNIEPSDQTNKTQFGHIRIDLTKDILSLKLINESTPD